MPRSVILLHTTPDGGSHFDWMIEREGCTGQHRLLTWRCESRADFPGWDGLASSIAVHRAAYLEFEGELSGLRGSVQRVARGEVVRISEGVDSLEVAIRWADSVLDYCGKTRGSAGDWKFSIR